MPILCFGGDAAEIARIKTFKASIDNPEIVASFDFEKGAPRNTAFQRKPGEGRNGTSALFYERTDPKAYPIASLRLDNLVPGKHYEVSVWVRAEGIEAKGSDKNIGAICVEFSKNGKWTGGSYYQTMSLGTDWVKITMTFQAPVEGDTDLKFYLRQKITGKIWFDDAVVCETTIPPAILLTRPDRLSFFGGETDFLILTDATTPENARILATVFNGGETRELLLKPEKSKGLSPVGFTFQGKAGKLQSGPVEITARLVDMTKETIVSEETFLLEARPAANPR